MKFTNKGKLNQFVVIPTFGIAWGDKGTHLYFVWLRFRIGIIFWIN